MKRIGYRIGDGSSKNGLTGVGKAAKNIIGKIQDLQEYSCMLLEQDVYGAAIPFDAGYTEKNKGNRSLPLQCMVNDIALVHSLYEPCFDEKGRFAKVMTIHDLIPVVHSEWVCYNYSWKEVFMKSARNADVIIADSEYTKKDIIEQFQIYPDKIKVVYLGMDSELISSDKTKDPKETAPVKKKYGTGDTYLLSVCALEPRKNTMRMLQAFEQYKEHHRDSGLKLVFAGKRRWFQDEISACIQNQEWLKDIIVTGYVEDEELKALYAGCTAVLYVSLYEGFGLPVLEGMSYARPVITSNVTSIPEIGGDAVIYCNPYAVDSIEEAIAQVVQNRIDVEALCKRAKERAAGFTYEKTARQIAGIYRTLLP